MNVIETAQKCGYQVYEGPKGGRVPLPRTSAITGIRVLESRGDLAVIEVERTTVYPSSCKYGRSQSYTRFLLGYNENGQPFSHCISKKAGTVQAALDWIWDGKADRIVARQGDVAVVLGRGKNQPLPESHVLLADGPQGEIRLVHLKEQHVPVAVPQGCHIIVGRRADDSRVRQTRD